MEVVVASWQTVHIPHSRPDPSALDHSVVEPEGSPRHGDACGGDGALSPLVG